MLKIVYHQLQESQKWHSVVMTEEYEDFFSSTQVLYTTIV